MKSIQIRRIKPTEISFLDEMLYEAVFVPKDKPALPRHIIKEPTIAVYTENWGLNNTDIALVATDNNKLTGAIWARNFTQANKGYGFISTEIPEMAMAIKPEYRSKGIGRKLLTALEIELRKKNTAILSLSVDKANYAYEFYQKVGFELVSEDEMSVVMKKNL